MQLCKLVAFFTLCACSTQPGSTGDAGNDPPDVTFDTGVSCEPSSCASGHCAPDGGCAQTCSGSSGCAAGETCCNGSFCTNVAKDPQNCGACGTACGMSQFCSGASCNDALVKNLCQNASGTVVLDNIAIDEDAGSVLSAALTNDCSSLKLVSVSQGQGGSMDPGSGRPMLGPGDTYIAAGGGFGQKAVAYMNSARNAPVYTVDDGQNVSFLRTADNSTIIKAPATTLTAHHDYFLVYAAAEPVSGTLVFAVYGLYGAGTAAGVYWFKTQSPSSLTKQYYVLEWNDTNNNGVPDSGDAFNPLDSN
jgi:hypothetical protein